MDKDLKHILEKLGKYAEFDPERIKTAYELAKKHHGGQKRHSGEPFIRHLLAVTDLLLELEADEDTIIAALLHDIVEDTGLTLPEIKTLFGKDVAQLVDGVTKISKEKFPLGEAQWKFQSLRKMFQIMGQDIRTILIKICDRLHNMQTLAFVSREKQLRIARETLEIYVPLAKRLNLQPFRSELTALSYQVLYPEFSTAFQKTQEKYQPKIEKQAKKISKWLESSLGKKFQVNILKRIYAIAENEAEYKLKSLELADTHTIQITTPKIEQCYQVLSLLHQTYRGKAASFKDYISTPKASGYQALHTNIITTDGEVLNIQILTAEMAHWAERGITLYWKGKKNSFTLKELRKLPIRIKWLEDLTLFIEEEEGNIEEMTEYLQKDFLRDRIFVFDKFGRFLDLPKGATVLDFLYSNSPGQAGSVTKTFVNGEESALDRELREGDKIEFTHDETPKINVSWLNSVKTYAAKRRIQAELARFPQTEKIAAGEKLLQKEFDIHAKGVLTRYGQKKWQQVWRSLGFDSFAELLQSIGEGQTKAEDVFDILFSQQKKISRLRYVFTFSKSEKNALNLLSGLAQQFHIEIKSINLKETKEHLKLYVEMGAAEQEDFERFLQKVQNLSGVQDVQMMLPLYARVLLATLWSAVFIFMAIFFAFREKFEGYHDESVGVLRGVLTYFPFLAVMLVNMVTIRNMKNYIKQMRGELAYMTAGMFLNLLSTLIILGLYIYLQIPFDLAIVLAMLLSGTLVTSYLYIRDSLDIAAAPAASAASSQESSYSRTEKIKGYLLRIAAVLIFGTSPVVVKYYLSGFNGVFVSTFSFFLAGVFLIPVALVRYIFLAKAKNADQNFQEKYHWTFFLAVLFDGLMVMVYFLSVQFTIASNSALFLNFAPVVALVFMLLFFRKKVPYLRKKEHTTRIIFLFLLGCLGSALLITNKIPSQGVNVWQKTLGDTIASLIVLFDVIATMATIHYAKRKNSFNGLDFIIRKVFILALFFMPIVLLKFEEIRFTGEEWLAFFWIAACYVILGYYFAYEAFRRVDGLIAYLLVNLAPIVTILLEVFLFDLPLSLHFVLGAVLIVGASIGAEYLNSKSPRHKAELPSALV